GATSQLWGFITSPDYKIVNNSLPLLKFRLAFTRYDFQSKTNVTEFLPVTAFAKLADRINDSLTKGMNYICCKCDIKVSIFTSKSGAQVQQQEHIINDFRVFSKDKSTQTQSFPQDPANGNTSGSRSGTNGNGEGQMNGCAMSGNAAPQSSTGDDSDAPFDFPY
ncbi:MAG: single-stranded DNA-binding protein, partial [Puniceicoccales bacterium]|nr:single-stranded DNA-binding protein [Puniceicoccales bacterium]